MEYLLPQELFVLRNNNRNLMIKTISTLFFHRFIFSIRVLVVGYRTFKLHAKV